MSTIGYAVGDWNSGKKVYPNPEFKNFARGFNRNEVATIKPFFIDRLNVRMMYNQLGINRKTYNERKFLYESFKKKGVSLVQLNKYWEKYRLRGNDGGNIQDFKVFVNQQMLLDKAKIDAENIKLAQLEEEEKKKEISDLNLILQTADKSLTDTTTISEDVVEDSKPNYLLYGGIALAVLVGGFIILKRR